MADLRHPTHPAVLSCACLAAGLLGACTLDFGDDGDDVTPDARVVFPDAPSPDAAVPTDAPIDTPTDSRFDAPPTPPALEILSPAENTLITGHDNVRIDVRVTGNPVVGFQLAIDGTTTTALTLSGLPPGGDCYLGCDVIVSWNADTMREGTHVATITANNGMGDMATDAVTLRFEDAPEITFQRPTGEVRGASTVAIQVAVVDRGPGNITAALSIDGVTAQSATWADCILGCTLTRSWNTSTLTPGVHTLSMTASDAAGRTSTVTQSVIVGDIPYVSQINVNASDGFGTLEVEVHMYDAATGVWLGCSGDEYGLANVAVGNTLYAVTGYFVDALSRPLGVDQLAGRNVRLVVTEDDYIECPATPHSTDEIIAQGPSIAAASLATLSTSFGNALQLTTRHGRPLAR